MRLRAVTLLLTRACNLSCRYCPRDRRRVEAMSGATLARALEVARELAGPRLDIEFSGGEPLLEPALLRQALTRVRSWPLDGPQVQCRLLTNGLRLTDAALDLLVEHDVGLQISCDGPRAQAARGPRTFAALDRRLGEIRRRHPDYWRRRVAVSAVFAPPTVGYLTASVAYFLARGLTAVGLAPACGSLTAWGPACCEELARQCAAIFDLAVEHRRRTGSVPLQHLRADDGGAAATCGAGLPSNGVIDTDGSVHGCGYLLRAAEPRLGDDARRLAQALRFGRVDDPGFRDRWYGRREAPPAVAVLRGRQGWSSPTGPCAACPLLAACQVCPLAGPVPGQVPDAHCLFQQLSVRDRQRFSERGPVADSLRAGGLAGADLRRVDRWFQAREAPTRILSRPRRGGD